MAMHRTPAERLAYLETKKSQIEARIEALSTRAKERQFNDDKRQRKDDDRRRVLFGSIVLGDLATNPSVANYICSRLPSVMRAGDERLFADLLEGKAS